MKTYYTGKVHIGLAYERKCQPVLDEHDQIIQLALLPKKSEPNNWLYFEFLVAVCAYVLSIFVMVPT